MRPGKICSTAYFCREKRPAGKGQDVVYIHEWYYSGLTQDLQDLHCINIYEFLQKELVILLIPSNAQGTAWCALPRSEERRVGKECRSRWSPYH